MAPKEDRRDNRECKRTTLYWLKSRTFNFVRTILHIGGIVSRGMMLIWGKEIREEKYTNKPVSLLMGSEVPCCGVGLSDICLLSLIIFFVV